MPDRSIPYFVECFVDLTHNDDRLVQECDIKPPRIADQYGATEPDVCDSDDHGGCRYFLSAQRKVATDNL